MGKDDQRLFDYDLSSPVEAISSLVERPIQDDLHDLSYRLPGGLEKGRAWLMVPRQSGPFPFVLALHGGGQDRDAFLAEAGLTAELGMASLLIDLPQARALPDFSRPDQDQEKFAQTVITVRRGLDYLAL